MASIVMSKKGRLSRLVETPLLEQSTSSEPPSIISWWDSCNAFSLVGEQVDKNDKDANSD
jgi:hypothetical protein